MKTPIVLRIAAAIASASVTYALFAAVVGLSEPQQGNSRVQLAKGAQGKVVR